MTIAQRLLLLITLFVLTLGVSVQSNVALAGIGGFEDEEPLMPDEAFVLSTKVIDANTIRAEWTIADKYYLYREKFKFISDTEGMTPGTADYPKGKIKEDEFFGEVETYRKKVSIDIPIARTGNASTLKMKITSQGCADMGICYPPQTKMVSFILPAMAAAETAVTPDDSFNPLKALKNLGNSLGLMGSNEKFLRAEEAFTFSVDAINGNLLRVHWDIADDVYLYQDKFKFTLKDANGITLGKPVLPEGKIKVDESFGEMVVYYHGVDIDIPVDRTNLDATDFILVAKYQGCADAGFCYPPLSTEMPVSLPAGLASAAAAVSNGTKASDADDDAPPRSEQDRIADSLSSGNTLLTIATFFGFGLLLAFTPCVFPMIPILSSIIVGQGEAITTRRAFIMSLVYVLAMALTYTAAGILAGAFGQNLQAAFQNPWILGSFAGVFVALSFSMFGFYDLQMPSFIQSKLTSASNSQQGGTLVGVGIMGLLSALIVGPCVAAPLAGALIYIGQTGDMVLGGMALFALSMGMGAPLLVIGASAGKLLPKAGTWMDTIKAVFGVMMLAVAVWMLERIIPVGVAMMLWATLMIGSAIYMGALDPVGEGSGWRKLWKGLGVVLMIYGALLLFGAAAGGKDTLQPLHGLAMSGGGGGAATGTASHGGEMVFKRIKGLAALDREVAAASAAGKSVMVDFYADWCVSCKEMEKYTFSDPSVQKALANTVLLQADVTVQDADDKALQKKFGIIGPPSILFFGVDGKERKAYRVVGFVKPGPFRDHVEKALR